MRFDLINNYNEKIEAKSIELFLSVYVERRHGATLIFVVILSLSNLDHSSVNRRCSQTLIHETNASD